MQRPRHLVERRQRLHLLLEADREAPVGEGAVRWRLVEVVPVVARPEAREAVAHRQRRAPITQGGGLLVKFGDVLDVGEALLLAEHVVDREIVDKSHDLVEYLVRHVGRGDGPRLVVVCEFAWLLLVHVDVEVEGERQARSFLGSLAALVHEGEEPLVAGGLLV